MEEDEPMQPTIQRTYLALLGVAVTVAVVGASFAAVLAGDSQAQTGAPVNVTPPTITGSATTGTRLQTNRGTWTGEQPIEYTYLWLRCNAQGAPGSCVEIPAANRDDYLVAQDDVGRTLRVRVTARNTAGSRVVTSAQTAVVQRGSETVQVAAIPRGERLVVSQIRFVPQVVTSRSQPITAQVRVRDTRGLLVQGAKVFMRATPRVTNGDRQTTGADGWVTLTLTPNVNFRVRTGYNVQFFIQAYREGDPALAGIQGSRLVQVRTRSA
jgi:hypothetical protein